VGGRREKNVSDFSRVESIISLVLSSRRVCAFGSANKSVKIYKSNSKRVREREREEEGRKPGKRPRGSLN
jgi:hypothetical protein